MSKKVCSKFATSRRASTKEFWCCSLFLMMKKKFSLQLPLQLLNKQLEWVEKFSDFDACDLGSKIWSIAKSSIICENGKLKRIGPTNKFFVWSKTFQNDKLRFQLYWVVDYRRAETHNWNFFLQHQWEHISINMLMSEFHDAMGCSIILIYI